MSGRHEMVGGDDHDTQKTNDDTFSQYSDRSMVEAAHRAQMHAIQAINEQVDENVVYLREEEDNRPILTRAYLINLCKTNQNLYYTTPEINDVLYLQEKNFKFIRNMHMFPDLKCLYFHRNSKLNINLEKYSRFRQFLYKFINKSLLFPQVART